MRTSSQVSGKKVNIDKHKKKAGCLLQFDSSLIFPTLDNSDDIEATVLHIPENLFFIYHSQ